jgi:tetratricopeptide (TPR) repeat protein
MRYLFKHVLLRDVAYDIQLRSRLRELHHRAAEAIETLYAEELSPYYADLAYHYGQAEVLEKERHYAFRAGEQAASEYANDAAVHFLSRALELTPESDREGWYRILSVRERVYDLQGAREAQRKDLQMLLVLAKGENKAKMVLRQAHYAETVGNYTGAVSFAQRAVHLAQRYKNVQLEAAAYLRWGRGVWRQGQYKDAIPHFEQALALARRGVHHPELAEVSRDLGSLGDIEADSLRNIGNVYWSQGQLDKAMAYYRDALPRYRALHHKKGEGATLNNIAIVFLNQGEYVQAGYYSERARQLKESIGDHIGAGIAYGTLGEVARQLGRYDEALAHHHRSLQLCRMAADSPGEGEAYISLARLHHLKAQASQTNPWALAWEHVQQGLTIAHSLHDMNLEADAQLCLGHISLGMGKLSEAQVAYARAWELRRDLNQSHGVIEALAGLADVALSQENWEQAHAHVEGILPYLGAHPTLDGVEEPCLVYWTCYRVLAALQEAVPDRECGFDRAEAASEVLAIAHRHLQAKAAKIEVVALRRSFLEDVTVRRQLIAAYQRWHERSPKAI